MRGPDRLLVLFVFAIFALTLPALAWAGGKSGPPERVQAGLQREVKLPAQRGSAKEAAAYAQREAAVPELEEFRGGQEVTVDLKVLLLVGLGFLLLVILIVVLL